MNQNNQLITHINSNKRFMAQVFDVTLIQTGGDYEKIATACRNTAKYKQFQNNVEIELSQIKTHKVSDIFEFLMQLQNKKIQALNYDVYLRFPYVSYILSLTGINPEEFNVTQALEQYDEPKYWYWAWIYAKNQQDYDFIRDNTHVHSLQRTPQSTKLSMITKHTQLNTIQSSDLFVSCIFENTLKNNDIYSQCDFLSTQFIKSQHRYFEINQNKQFPEQIKSICHKTDGILVFQEQLFEIYKMIFNQKTSDHLQNSIISNRKILQNLICRTKPLKDELIDKIYEPVLSCLINKKFASIVSYAYMLFETILAQYAYKNHCTTLKTPYKTGLSKIDTVTGGLNIGEVVLIATECTNQAMACNTAVVNHLIREIYQRKDKILFPQNIVVLSQSKKEVFDDPQINERNLFFKKYNQFLLKQSGLFDTPCDTDYLPLRKIVYDDKDIQKIIHIEMKNTINSLWGKINNSNIIYINASYLEQSDIQFLKKIAKERHLCIILHTWLNQAHSMPELSKIQNFENIKPFVDKIIAITTQKKNDLSETDNNFIVQCLYTNINLSTVQTFVLSEAEIFIIKKNIEQADVIDDLTDVILFYEKKLRPFKSCPRPKWEWIASEIDLVSAMDLNKINWSKFVTLLDKDTKEKLKKAINKC